MITIFLAIILLFLILGIYRATGSYQVWTKASYSQLENDKEWTPMFTGNYTDCSTYIHNAKRNGTDLLGFKEEFKLKRI